MTNEEYRDLLIQDNLKTKSIFVPDKYNIY